MNKAAFLDILNHVTSISEQEVIELEKLALNFPYCQSAHLLLAKAAYDKGSMLSNQRLRRAAACAANRQLLKKLINTAGHHLVLEPIADEVLETAPLSAVPAAPQEEILPEADARPQEHLADQGPRPMSAATDLPTLPLEPIETEALDVEEYDAPLQGSPYQQIEEAVKAETATSKMVEQVEQEEVGLEPIELESLELESLELESLELEALAPEREPAVGQAIQVPALEPIEPEPLELESLEAQPFVEAQAPQDESSQPESIPAPTSAQAPTEQVLPESLDNTLPEIYEIPELLDDADIAAAAQPEAAAVADAESPLAQEMAQDSLHAFSDDFDDLFRVDFLASVVPALDPVAAFVSALPAQEPEEAAQTDLEASQPLLLTEPVPLLAELPAAAAGAQTPAGEETDETLASFDQFLFSPEKEQEAPAAAPQPYQEEILYKVFDANELGYWMDSSRLGETLLRKNELARAQPYYFRPELLLEYSRHHEIASYQAPEPSILARQFDIIDQFLKLNPKIKSMAQVKIKPESQEDLSLKSTKIRKNTASETLATILVQQGKIKKAIKIYEHLILKLPEKKDYFASQIDKLQTLI